MVRKEDRTSTLVVRGHHLPELINEIARSELYREGFDQSWLEDSETGNSIIDGKFSSIKVVVNRTDYKCKGCEIRNRSCFLPPYPMQDKAMIHEYGLEAGTYSSEEFLKLIRPHIEQEKARVASMLNTLDSWIKSGGLRAYLNRSV